MTRCSAGEGLESRALRSNATKLRGGFQPGQRAPSRDHRGAPLDPRKPHERARLRAADGGRSIRASSIQTAVRDRAVKSARQNAEPLFMSMSCSILPKVQGSLRVRQRAWTAIWPHGHCKAHRTRWRGCWAAAARHRIRSGSEGNGYEAATALSWLCNANTVRRTAMSPEPFKDVCANKKPRQERGAIDGARRVDSP